MAIPKTIHKNRSSKEAGLLLWKPILLLTSKLFALAAAAFSFCSRPFLGLLPSRPGLLSHMIPALSAQFVCSNLSVKVCPPPHRFEGILQQSLLFSVGMLK